MTVGKLKLMLEEYSDETEISVMDTEANQFDIDEVVLYNPALSCEPIEKNHLTLMLVDRD